MSCLCPERLSSSSEGLGGKVGRGTKPQGSKASETKLEATGLAGRQGHTLSPVLIFLPKGLILNSSIVLQFSSPGLMLGIRGSKP